MRPALLAVLLVVCGLIPPDAPPPAPPLDDATGVLDRVIDAALARDFDELCSLATETCERELEGVEHLAPNERPTIVETEVHEPRRSGNGWSTGGVLFVLCGRDATGEPYESEVLVSDDAGRSLLATAAVFWIGAGIVGLEEDEVVVGGGLQGGGRC